MAKIAAFVFAGGLNIPNMSVYELVSLGRFPHTNWIGTIRKKDTEIIEDAINCVGLTRYRNTNVGELSDGERQRAMIARALAQDTDLLILDEPTAFLDLPNRFELIHLLKNLIRHKGKSVILSSHDLDISIREADKLWLALEDGLKQGSPEDLVIEGVLGSVFRESQIEFDENDGVFKYPVTTRMNIRLEGSGLERYWTERALNRIGIKANAESVSPSITVKYEGKFRWLYESAATRQEFYTVYDFIIYMKSVLSQS